MQTELKVNIKAGLCAYRWVLYVKSVQQNAMSGKRGQVQAPEGIISVLYDFPWEDWTSSSCNNKHQEQGLNSHSTEKFILK